MRKPLHLSFVLRRLALSWQVLALCALAACAQPGRLDANNPKAQRFADLYMQTLPVDRAMQELLRQVPAWPFQDFEGKVSREQLACVRNAMAPEIARATLRKRALEYAAQHPERIDRDIALLDTGLAPYFGGALMAGVQEGIDELHGKKSVKSIPKADLKTAKASFMLRMEPENAPLRKVLYFDSIESGKDAEQSGEAMGMRLYTPFLFSAMEQCQVKFEQLQ